MIAPKSGGYLAASMLVTLLAAQPVSHAHAGTGGMLEGSGATEPMAALPQRSDVVPWSRLARVKTREENGKVVAIFAPPVKALHRKRVRLQGYMQPLDASRVQRQFLLTVVPMTCPEGMPGGPVSVVYVRVANPIEFAMGPMVVEGVLDVGRNSETGMYYRMSDAVLVKN